MKLELRSIDQRFAGFICRESDSSSPDLWWIAALVSHAVGQGHICLNLADVAGKELSSGEKSYQLLPLENLIATLKAAAAVGAPGDFRPLVLDGAGRLYLQRYWKYEDDLAYAIMNKARSLETICEEVLRGGLARFFPAFAGGETDWQAIAAIAALRKQLCIISGGPGTGKTSTVVKILALILEQQPHRQQRIAMAAPTGKAAARLKESISRMKSSLDCSEEIRLQIPTAVSTIHKLLGFINGSVRFRYNAENPLPHDVVIIDEASMVDLPLMAKLITALKQDARLILLGDRDQLASVEAGAVLGDLCGNGRKEFYSPEFCELVKRLTGTALTVSSAIDSAPVLGDALVILKKNYRFQSNSNIGLLAAAVNAGNGNQALALMESEDSLDASWNEIPEPAVLKKALTPEIIDGYHHYLAAKNVEESLIRFDGFRVLCALRKGPYGVESITALVEKVLAEKGLIDPHNNRWYRGRPILITANDYSTKLFNGDVGIVYPDRDADGAPRVYFALPEGGIRSVSPVRLPAHETVYAMTVHKSQGSEFKRVLLLLPKQDSPVLSRELLYTAITRSVEGVKIWGGRGVFIEAAIRKVRRKSGLLDVLWKDL